MVSTISPSTPIRMKALGVKPSPSADPACPPVKGRSRLSSRPPPRAAVVLRKLRRDVMRCWIIVGLLASGLRRLLDRLANPDIGAAAADIAGHGGINIGVRRARIGRQQS